MYSFVHTWHDDDDDDDVVDEDDDNTDAAVYTERDKDWRNYRVRMNTKYARVCSVGGFFPTRLLDANKYTFI